VIYRVGLLARVPSEPQLAVRLADGWAQQVKAGLAQALSFLHPSAVVTLQRLDTVGGVVLHALEDDHAVALLGLDDGFLHLEVSASVHGLNLGLQQPLDRLVQ
jgi:predicted NBD/HSP70 family sugar kinase